MANLVQRQAGLILLAGWSVFAATSSFSHRVHLARKLDCIVCHSAARTSTKATDNLIPPPGICKTCHADAARANYTPEPARNVNVQHFNHELHAKLGQKLAASIVRAIDNNRYLAKSGAEVRAQLQGTTHACTACHRGLATSDQVSAANLPAMADCLVCHNRIEPPFSCEKCHENVASLKPASHTTGFLDKHSDKSVPKEGCAICHGRRFTCLGCH